MILTAKFRHLQAAYRYQQNAAVGAHRSDIFSTSAHTFSTSALLNRLPQPPATTPPLIQGTCSPRCLSSFQAGSYCLSLRRLVTTQYRRSRVAHLTARYRAALSCRWSRGYWAGSRRNLSLFGISGVSTKLCQTELQPLFNRPF